MKEEDKGFVWMLFGMTIAFIVVQFGFWWSPDIMDYVNSGYGFIALAQAPLIFLLLIVVFDLFDKLERKKKK